MSSSSIRIYKSLQKFKLLISSQSSHIPSPPLRHPAAPRWTRSSCSRAPSQPSPPSPRSGMPPLAPLPAMDIIKRTLKLQRRILAFSVPFRTTPSFLTMDTSLRTLRRPIITGSTSAKKNQNKDPNPFAILTFSLEVHLSRLSAVSRPRSEAFKKTWARV